MQLPSNIPDPLAGVGRFQTLGYLGSGVSGLVVRALDSSSDEVVAIKLLRRDSFSRYVESEIINHSMLCHPQIIQFKTVFLTDDYVCIVMEYATAGNLFNYVRQHKRLAESVARYFFQQLMIGVDYCHKRGVANRDLKLDNILLHDVAGWPLPLLKICDFGYSKSDQKSAPASWVGTLRYMAPEVLLGHSQDQYDGKVADIWSCGIILYVMVFGGYPYDLGPTSGSNSTSTVESFRRTLDDMLNRRLTLPKDVDVSRHCVNLLWQMLHPDPRSRITLADILVHPWFQKNLPPDVASMNARYLQTTENKGVETTAGEIQSILEIARKPVAPSPDDEMIDMAILEENMATP